MHHLEEIRARLAEAHSRKHVADFALAGAQRQALLASENLATVEAIYPRMLREFMERHQGKALCAHDQMLVSVTAAKVDHAEILLALKNGILDEDVWRRILAAVALAMPAAFALRQFDQAIGIHVHHGHGLYEPMLQLRILHDQSREAEAKVSPAAVTTSFHDLRLAMDRAEAVATDFLQRLTFETSRREFEHEKARLTAEREAHERDAQNARDRENAYARSLPYGHPQHWSSSPGRY